MQPNKLIKQASLLAIAITSISSAPAQKLPNTVKPADRALLNQKANDLYKIIDPIAAKVSQNVVIIKLDNKLVAMGTVTEAGIITKLSEISKLGVEPRIVDHQGNVHPVKLKSSNKDYDLALLENPAKLPALKLTASTPPKLGSFILAASATKQAISTGVISVESRSLKESDRGYLGVIMAMENKAESGVMLVRVEEKTAASRAGLQAGDVVTKVNNTEVNNMIQLRNLLQQQKPGDTIIINYIRDEQLVSGVKVTLGARKETPGVPRSRMNFMKRMGGKVNQVGEGFPDVLQSDIQIEREHCGAPILDLDGNFVGIAIARSSRIKTYIIETKRLAQIFKK